MRSGFTLVEMLVVVAIISALGFFIIVVLNPRELIAQAHDSRRISDLDKLNSAVDYFHTELTGFAGSSSIVYLSLPDPAATTTAGSDCSSLNLSSLPTGWSYHCAASSTYRKANGTGWMPMNFLSVTTGATIETLPIDPLNVSSSRFYYSYVASSGLWEFDTRLESAKYGPSGPRDTVTTDGGDDPSVYERGSLLTAAPAGSGGLGNSPIDATLRYAWSENIGWIDFGDLTGNVGVNGSQLIGYASSSVGWIALDCATSPNGNICGTSNFKVANDGAGNLSGWAWNDTIGWISFNCADQGVCGVVNYKVTIDSSGNFSGWAWSEDIGWISFNCADTSSCGTTSYYVKTSWTH